MSKRGKITLFVLLGVLVAAIISAAALIIHDTVSTRANVISELEKKNDELTRNGERLEMSLSQLEDEKKRLEIEVAELELKLNDAGESFKGEIEALKADIEAKMAEIAALEADIAKYRTVFNIDVRAQAQLIDEIVSYIETACPYVRVFTPDPEFPDDPEKVTESWRLISELMAEEQAKLDEGAMLFTEEELAMSGLTAEELTTVRLRELVLAREDVKYPCVSIYYEDLATGYHFDYNADVPYNSASVIKAPYLLSLLKAVSDEEKAYLDALSEKGEVPEMIDDDGDGTPDRAKIEYSDPTLDLYEKVIYTKAEMYQDGSGKIQEMEDGTEFSYLDFVKYTLEYSDNVAYQALRKRFGFSRMSALAYKLGVNIQSNSMTARGAGKLFSEIYKFTEEDETYGKIMAESMKKANHTVIIPFGVSPDKALHKYGWDTDSYHDAAVVLSGDKPYVLAVFSDLDKGGNEINLYLREIVKMIHKLHRGFYNS